MAIFSNEQLQNFREKLLGNKEEEILSILEELGQQNDAKSIQELQAALIIIKALHTDENLRKKASELLTLHIEPESLKKAEQGFEIFKSIAEYYPWMGDYTELQKTNFEKFRQIKDPYVELLAKSEIYSELYIDMGRKLYMLYHLEAEAQLCFEDIISYDDKNDEAYYALGRVFEKQHQYKRAQAHYERCIANNEKNVYGLLQLGFLKSKKLGKHNEAIYHYGKIIEMNPYSTEAYVRTAEAYFDLEEMQRCIQFIDIAIGINEHHEEALNLRGKIYWKIDKDFEKAEETFQKGLDHQMHGDSGLLLGSLAEMHVEAQDFDKGRLFYEKSLKAQPNQPEVLQRYVMLLVRHYQDYGSAMDHYEKYLKMQPNDSEAHVAYAELLVNYIHDYHTASEYVQKALELDSEMEAAKELEKQLQAYLKEEEEEEEDDDDDDDDDDDFVGGGAADDN